MSTTSVGNSELVERREVSRLLTAAVVNKRFCKLLLSNPASALASGYNGESFSIEREEKDFIVSIQAKTLAEFARQLHDEQEGEEPGRIRDGANQSRKPRGFSFKALSYS